MAMRCLCFLLSLTAANISDRNLLFIFFPAPCLPAVGMPLVGGLARYLGFRVREYCR